MKMEMYSAEITNTSFNYSDNIIEFSRVRESNRYVNGIKVGGRYIDTTLKLNDGINININDVIYITLVF